DKKYKIAGRNVFYAGIGKCAISAGRAIEKVLGDALAAGIAFDVSVNNPADQQPTASKLETIIGTHPLPSAANILGAKRIIEFLGGKSANDLIIFVISGGGSALLCSPLAPMTCTDESELFGELTARGATIQEMNVVRKRTSSARGGALAVAAYPAEIISLIFSDVPDNDIASVASGPTAPDNSTVADAKSVLVKYGITNSAVTFIETPKEPKYFERVANVLFLSNRDALSGMRAESARRGYAATIVNDCLVGEAQEIGRAIAEKLHALPQKTALLYAGESTVALDENFGKGGRNQEMALAALEYLNRGELILPFASDGRDNTAHAGAVADEVTRTRAREKSLSAEEHLRAHNSYDFFKSSGDALITGYTGSNVSDLVIALKK
ncbi:DUF4147 domain-containing protein, partial [Candidatus Kaiserbacteria bacterium]|nr:DUF4147 domain-containing protein [Candidatus Kaiserbacteria bacterium]